MKWRNNWTYLGVRWGAQQEMDMKKVILGTAVALMLAACATDETAKPAVSTAPAAAAVTPAAAIVALDDSDRAILEQTLQAAAKLPAGQGLSWTNPASG